MAVDLTQASGQVRFLAQDAGDNPFFTDDQITFLLTRAGADVNVAAIEALRTKARNYASRAEKQIGDATYDYAAASKQLFAAADQLAQSLQIDLTDEPAIGEAGGQYEESIVTDYYYGL